MLVLPLSLMWERKSQLTKAPALCKEIPETIINLPLSLHRKPNGRALQMRQTRLCALTQCIISINECKHSKLNNTCITPEAVIYGRKKAA